MLKSRRMRNGSVTAKAAVGACSWRVRVSVEESELGVVVGLGLGLGPAVGGSRWQDCAGLRAAIGSGV